MWDPCKGYNCTSMQSGMDCAVCQNIVQGYNVSCGKMSEPVWMWDTKTGNWQIEYTFGDSWRYRVRIEPDFVHAVTD